MKTDQLSALELMMARADEIYTQNIGAPTTRKRKRSNSEMTYASDFLTEAEQEMFEDSYVVEVGSSRTRRISAETSAKNIAKTPSKNASKAPVAGNISDQAVSLALVKPSQNQLDRAFSEVFTDNRTDAIVDVLEENVKFSKETAETLKKWLKWERDQAYIESTKIDQSDRQIKADNAVTQANDNAADAGGGGLGFPDRDRGRNRRPPKGKVPPKPSKWKARGKWGALLGLGLGAGYFMSRTRDEDSTQDEAKPESKLEQYDAGVNAGLAGSWALGAAKKVPFVGPAVALGSGAWDTAKIAANDDLTDEQKEREYTKTTVATTSAMVGTGVGTLIGGFIGSIVPVAGTAAGAAFGGMLGGILGDFFGNSIGEYVADMIQDETEEAKEKRLDALATYRNYDENAPMFGPRSVAAAGGFAGNAIGQQIGIATGVNNGVDGVTGASRIATPTALKSDREILTGMDNKRLGFVTEHFESGGLGVGVVSTGKGDHGGVSYGRHQLASKTGTMQTFIDSPENAKYKARFQGLAPGSAEFNAVYRQIAQEDPEGFGIAQENFINRTHYEPLTEKLQNNLGHNFKNRGRAVQEYLHTYANQFGAGGASSRLTDIFKGQDLENLTDREIIEKMNDYRINNVGSYMRSSSEAVQAGVKSRAEREGAVLLEMADMEAAKAREKSKSEGLAITEATQTAGVIGQAAAIALASQKEHEVNSTQATKVDSTQEVQMQPVPQEITPPPPPAESTTSSKEQDRREKSKLQASATTQPQQGYQMMTHTLNHIPVYIDDPVMNMMKVGYA